MDIVIDSERAIKEAGLTLQQQKVIELRWVEGDTQQEVADMLQLSQPTVLQHEQYAKKKVQKLLDKWGRS